MLNARSASRALVAIAVALIALIALVVVLVLRSGRTEPERPVAVFPRSGVETVESAPELEVRAPSTSVRTALVPPPKPAQAPSAERERTPLADKPGRLKPKGWQVFPEPVETPEGVLEVLVLFTEGPAANVTVSMHGQENAARRAADEPQDPADEKVTGIDGIVRFDPVPAGDYALHVCAAPTVCVDQVAYVGQGQKSRRVLVRFGASAVHGTVHGPDGQPWPRAEVVAICEVQDGHSYRRNVRADDEGRYRFDRLPASFVILMQNPIDREHADWPRNRARFVLESAEDLEVDLGSAQPFALCTGVVRDTSGEALEIPARITFDELDRGYEHGVSADARGRFSVELPRGLWVARSIEHYPGVELGRFEVASDRLEHDLVVPGIVVQLRLRAEPASGARLFLRGTIDRDRSIDFQQIGQARFALVTKPDVYRLLAQPEDALAGTAGVGLEVDLRHAGGSVDVNVENAPR